MDIFTKEDRKFLQDTAGSVVKDIECCLKEKCSIEHIYFRVKENKSMLDKLDKKRVNLHTVNERVALKYLTDIIGIRIIVPFIADVYDVRRRLCESGLFHVIETVDYIADPKENGYRSLHMIIELPAAAYGAGSFYGHTTICAEIQIRTVSMDGWATLEHCIFYKKDPDMSTPEYIFVQKQLSKIADSLNQAEIDIQGVYNIVNVRGKEEDYDKNCD